MIEEFATCNRTYGLWFLGQGCTSCALVVLAAAAGASQTTLPHTGTSDMSRPCNPKNAMMLATALPANWAWGVMRLVQILRRWETETLDFKVNAELLEHLLGMEGGAERRGMASVAALIGSTDEG
jgi:hypothetical protein